MKPYRGGAQMDHCAATRTARRCSRGRRSTAWCVTPDVGAVTTRTLDAEEMTTYLARAAARRTAIAAASVSYASSHYDDHLLNGNTRRVAHAVVRTVIADLEKSPVRETMQVYVAPTMTCPVRVIMLGAPWTPPPRILNEDEMRIWFSNP